MESSTFVIIVLSVLGISFSIAGFFMLKNYRKIRDEGRKTKAKVIDILEEYSNDGKTYRLVVEFKTYNGKLITQELDFSSGFKPKKQPPYPYEIYYLEENGKIKILPAKSNFHFVLCFLFILVGLSCLGILSMIFTGHINLL